MTKAGGRTAAELRVRLGHPVVDADGHMVEIGPVALDYIRQVGGQDMADRYRRRPEMTRWYLATQEQRRDERITARPWWGMPTRNTSDRALAMFPRLFAERMDDLGIDYAIVYPSDALTIVTAPGIDDPELRCVAARAFNVYLADIYREHSDRMTPAAVIPMATPQEAVAEMEYAVRTLGLKVAAIGSEALRQVPKAAREHPGSSHVTRWPDPFALDSLYDYDPVWAKAVELRLAVNSHGGTMGWATRTSISSYCYNHIGSFAAAGEALCKALFMGGVTRRFPTLNFAFLEGGVAWACGLLSDLLGHWEKRNGKAMRDLDPAALDVDLLMDLYSRYVYPQGTAHAERVRQQMARPLYHPEELDDFAAGEIREPEDLYRLFVPRFYFGCEADDRLNAWAFDTRMNPFGARLRAMFGSDIGHWDVPNAQDVLPEAYELVERGLLTPEDFRDFVFTNAVRLHGGMNPDFFKATRIEKEAAKALAKEDQR